MQLVGEIAEDEVVCTFLAADLASPRDCADLALSRLAARDVGPEALDRDSNSPGSKPGLNELRRRVLCECHGATLAGFPAATTTWHRAELLDDDELYLMDYHEFRDWTADTLRPSDAVAGFRENRTLDAAVEAITRGEAMAPSICVARSTSAPAVVLDGSQRAVAKAHLRTPRPEPILLGISAGIAGWNFYPRRHIR
jgi:hypothetical protein